MRHELDLRLVRTFVAVAEDLHFGHAARRLHVTQPAVSVQVRKLEHIVGVELLARTSRHVELTPAGEIMLDEGRRMLAGAERAIEAARQAAGGQRGRLVVGFIANAAGELTPEVIGDFRARHPDVQLEMRQFDFGDPYAGLADGSADVAFVRLPLAVHDWLGIETLFVEPRALAVSVHNPLARRDVVTLEMLSDEPFVARRAPVYWRNFWLATEQRFGAEPRIGAEVATVDECFEAILQDRGVAFTQRSTERFYARPGLTFVAVQGIAPSSVAIAWRRDADSTLARDFVAVAQRLAVTGTAVPETTLPAHLTLADVAEAS